MMSLLSMIYLSIMLLVITAIVLTLVSETLVTKTIKFPFQFYYIDSSLTTAILSLLSFRDSYHFTLRAKVLPFQQKGLSQKLMEGTMVGILSYKLQMALSNFKIHTLN